VFAAPQRKADDWSEILHLSRRDRVSGVARQAGVAQAVNIRSRIQKARNR
jgi:hypothetical protein